MLSSTANSGQFKQYGKIFNFLQVLKVVYFLYNCDAFMMRYVCNDIH